MWWFALRNFHGISWEQVLLNDSSEILEKFSGIGHQFESFFKGSEFWELVWKIPQMFSEIFLQEIPEHFHGIFFRKFLRLEYFLGNSWDWNFSPEIPEKFLELCHQFYGFFWELNKRQSLEKFLRISIEYISRFSLEILRTGYQFYNFLGEGKKDLVSINSWEFLQNFFPEISKNFWGIFLLKSLRNSQDCITNFTELSSSVFLQEVPYYTLPN